MTNGRTKGHAYERKIAVDFQEMGFDAITKRAARGGDWSTTDDGIDLVGTEPFAVQVKRYRDYVPVNTIEEIHPGTLHDGLGFAVDSEVPILITKADHKPAMAVLPWEELQKLIRAAFPKS